MKTYYLEQWAHGTAGLSCSLGERYEFETVAYQLSGIWRLANPPWGAIDGPGEGSSITEDEAAMILFQCQEPA